VRKCVADLEANGLLQQATVIHCGCFIDVDTQEVFHFRPHQMDEMCKFMDTCEELIMHNGIMYDFPLMEKVLGYSFKGKQTDTLLISQLLFSERLRHGVEAWGDELEREKPKHEDWTTFSEEMMHRCSEDTHIQLQIYKKCIEKAKWFKQQNFPYPKKALDMTHEYFKLMSLQERAGWQFDVDKAKFYVDMLNRWVWRIDRVINPQLPQVLEKKGVPVNRPFKKDGSYSKMTTDWYGDDSHLVGGTFCRIEWRLLDLSKPIETKDYLLSLGWKPKYWNEDVEGKQTTPKLSKDDPFVGLDGKLGRLIARRFQSVQRRSIIEGWIDNCNGNGRLSQQIRGLADTRRLKHGVLVNVPSPEAFFGRQMRSLFISRDGFKLVGTDASGCQDRMLLSRGKWYNFDDPKFEHMLLHGDKDAQTDSHSQAMIAINKALKKHNLNLINRKTAKNFNFAYKFACGDAKLGDMAHAPVKDKFKIGVDIRAEMDKLFNVQRATSDYLKEFWSNTAKPSWNELYGKMEKQDGYIPALDGAPVRVRYEKDCLVYTLQSDEAVLMQYALLFFHKWATQLGWVWWKDFAYVGVAHDEFTIEVREHLAEKCKELAEKAINRASTYLNLAVEQIGDGQIGDTWLDIH
jgi:DNA polymerase-1